MSEEKDIVEAEIALLTKATENPITIGFEGATTRQMNGAIRTALAEITRLRGEVERLTYQYKCACETVEAQYHALNKRQALTFRGS